MSEQHNQHGRREAPKSPNPLAQWWGQHRAWVAGLDRRGKLYYRLLQVAVVLSVVIIAATLALRAWIKLPEVPNLPGIGGGGGGVGTSQLQPGKDGELSYEGAELPDVTRSGRKDGYYTFLLCGRDVVSGSTDTMMLITYDTQSKKINAISLLRDTMINTSGKSGGQKRLNAVFGRNMGDRKLSDKERVANGMTALKKEVSRLTGVYPDFYVLVEWEAIGRLVDAVDGVEFEVPYDMDYDDSTPGQDLHIHQKKGLRVLDGQDAMEVIRFRKNNDRSISLGDVGRTEIQRDFMVAVLKKCLTPEILLKLPTLVNIFMENVDTDLAVGNILAFAQLAIGMDVENGVKFSSMPCYGVMYKGASLVCAQEKELLALLNDGLNPYVDEIKSSDLQLMYKKSGGGFGVTNGALADPAVAVVSAPKPEEPDESDEPEDPAVTDPENPGETTDPGTETDPGTTTDPDTTPEPGGTTDPGATPDPGTETPGNIGDIDPSTVFPDPVTQGGEAEDTVQPAA